MNQASFCNQALQAIFHRRSYSYSIQHCLDNEVWIVEGCRPLRADRQSLAPLFKLPPIQTLAEAKSDTGVIFQILRMLRNVVRFEVLLRSHNRKTHLFGDANCNHVTLDELTELHA